MSNVKSFCSSSKTNESPFLPYEPSSSANSQATRAYHSPLLLSNAVMKDDSPYSLHRSHSSTLKRENDLDFEDVVDEFHEDNIFQEQLWSSGKDWINNSEFSSGLTLLQADVVHLCLSVGINPKDLWPPQAMLLNLNILYEFCLRQTGRNDLTCEDKRRVIGGKNDITVKPTRDDSYSDFRKLDDALKLYCTVIRGESKESNRTRRDKLLNGSDIGFLTEYLLSISRDNCADSVRSHFLNFDSSRYRSRDRYSDTEHSVEKDMMSRRGDACLTDEIVDDNELVHITYDYVESD